MTEKFAEAAFKFSWIKSAFEDKLNEVLGGGDYEDIGWDSYDCSLEICKVSNDIRLSIEAQKFIFDSGFSKVYVNHNDEWETHYGWGAEFKPQRGWRRKRTEKGFLISYWPEGWTGKSLEWKDNGYMTIVPDPLEIKVDA